MRTINEIRLFLFATLLFLISGCIMPLYQGGEPDDQPNAQQMMRVNLTIGVKDGLVSSNTKAVVGGNENLVHSMSIVCFDINGFYIGTYPLVVTPAQGATLSHDYGVVTGEVPITTTRAHFIANKSFSLPSSLASMEENTLMHGGYLISTLADTEIAYWGYHRENTAEAMQAFLNSDTPNKIWLLRDRARVVPGAVNDDSIQKIEWVATNGKSNGYIAPFNAGAANPFEGYETGGAATSKITPYGSDEDRYNAEVDDFKVFYEDGAVVNDNSLFLFEDYNLESDPVKIVFKVTYNDNTVRYHLILLIQGDYSQWEITRNHSYTVSINKLPKDMGLPGTTEWSDVIASTVYSNNQMVQISHVVSDITNGVYALKITETTGTAIVYLTPAAGGEKHIGFQYTVGEGGEANSESDFSVSWVENDGSISDPAVSPTVSYNSSTGEGTINIILKEIKSTLSQGVLLLRDTKHGLSRYVNVYSISKFEIGTPSLSRVAGKSRLVGKVDYTNPTTGVVTTLSDGSQCNTYKMTFTIPGIYPSSMYPINVQFTTRTLNAFSDVSADVPSGSFSIGIETTAVDNIVDGTSANAWNYEARSWNYWYTYTILTKPANDTDTEYTLYFDDVSSFHNPVPTQLGLYYRIQYFGRNADPATAPGAAIAVGPINKS